MPSPTPPPQSHPHPLALPPSFSPDAIDALTELSLVLSRLKTPVSAQPPSDPAAAAELGPGGHLLPNVNNIGELPIKEVASAADLIKHKLQRARQDIKKLPDMSRTIAEQEEEIAFLEDKLKKQRELLESLKAVKSEGVGVVEEGR